MPDPTLGTTVDVEPPSGRELDEPIHLMIADDDPQTRELLAQTLTGLGFQVVAEASDGIEACQQARKFYPEVVLMDMRMPDLGGLRAAQMIKAERPRTQVLILSAYSDEFAELGPELAGVATLSKNVPLEEIAGAIRAAAEELREDAVRRTGRRDRWRRQHRRQHPWPVSPRIWSGLACDPERPACPTRPG